MRIKGNKVGAPIEKISKDILRAKEVAYLLDDIGIAQTNKGQVFFKWGGYFGNLSKEDLTNTKKYVFIGSIYDVYKGKSRNNYAEVIAKGGLLL